MINKIYAKIKEVMTEYWLSFLFLFLISFLFLFDTSYVIYTPGNYIDLSKRITVSEGYKSDGTLGMAYVSVIKGNLAFIGLSYLNKNWDLVSKNDLTLPNEDIKTANKREKISMETSRSNAIISAYTLAGKQYEITNSKKIITYLNSPDTELELFDEIRKVDGKSITDLEMVKNIVASKQIGDKINIEVLRDEEIRNVSSVIWENNQTKVVGLSFSEVDEVKTTPSVEIQLKDNESGPSGGLMMSLGIYNALVEEDITKGKKIIGTGTIDKEGNVGEIGGVKYKLIGAVKNKAEIFLCPKENYEEAKSIANENNYSIKIIAVSSLKEAIEELKKG